MEPRRVVVIGGGLAGLASAVWLAEAGERVTLLERRGSLGGRTHSMDVAPVDDLTDNGQHVFASGYEHLFRYLESLGTRDFVRFPPTMGVRLAGGGFRRQSFVGLAGLRMALGDLPGCHGLDRARTAVAQAKLIAQSVRQPRDLDEITATEWFDRLGLPQAARDAVWDGIVIGLTGDKPDISSAKVPADLLATGLRQARKLRKPISIGHPTTDLDTLYVDGALRVFAEHGVEVRHRAVARSIEVRDGAVVGVTLADGELVDADAVVCAVPVWNIRGLLDQVPGHADIYAAAEHLTPVPIVSVYLYLDRSIEMDDWGEILHGGEGVLEQVWDHQAMYDHKPQGSWRYSTTVSAAYDLTTRSNEEITATQLEMLRSYYPAARDAQVVHSHVVRMPRSTFAQRPGTFGLRPDQRTDVRGLALAGDWTRTDWTTTMEGAAQSAARAVEVILATPRERVPVSEARP